MQQGVDILFEIYLPVDVDWSAYPFQVPMFEWDGVQYPQGEPRCNFGKNWKLTKWTQSELFWFESLPLSHRTTAWHSIFIDGPGLYICRSSLQGYMEEDAESMLKELLQWLLAGQPKWMVCFMPGAEQLDDVIPGDIETVVEKIALSLAGENKGYVVWGGRGN